MAFRLHSQGPGDPAFNMAMDECLAEAAAESGRAILRFYEWDRPALTIGYFQKRDAAPAEGITVVRRLSGGGLVDHRQDFTFSLSLPSGHELARINRFASYERVNEAVRLALAACGVNATLTPDEVEPADRARMHCFATPARHDVLQGEQKLAGGAQRRTARYFLHQGSITLLPGLARAALADALATRFVDLLGEPAEAALVSDEQALTARSLADEKYATAGWNGRR